MAQRYSTTLQALANKDARIDSYEYDGESHWLHLADGWVNKFDDTHCICESTVGEVIQQLRDEVSQCAGSCCNHQPKREPKTMSKQFKNEILTKAEIFYPVTAMVSNPGWQARLTFSFNGEEVRQSVSCWNKDTQPPRDATWLAANMVELLWQNDIDMSGEEFHTDVSEGYVMWSRADYIDSNGHQQLRQLHDGTTEPTKCCQRGCISCDPN